MSIGLAGFEPDFPLFVAMPGKNEGEHNAVVDPSPIGKGMKQRGDDLPENRNLRDTYRQQRKKRRKYQEHRRHQRNYQRQCRTPSLTHYSIRETSKKVPDAKI
jgi:hypothetical protein